MNLKLVIAVSLIAAIPTLAQAQKNAPPASAPKPAMADVQKVVQMIGGDKEKMQTYCDLGKLQDEMEQLDEKKDAKKLEALSAKADGLAQKLGPDYLKLMDALDQVDSSSPEGKQFTAAFDTLSKQCK